MRNPPGTSSNKKKSPRKFTQELHPSISPRIPFSFKSPTRKLRQEFHPAISRSHPKNIPGISSENSSRNFMREFIKSPIREFLHKFQMRIPPKIPSENSFSNSIWGFLQKFDFFRNFIRKILHDFLWEFLQDSTREFLQRIYLGIALGIPSEHFSWRSIWGFLQKYYMEITSEILFWEIFQGLCARNSQGISTGNSSKNSIFVQAFHPKIPPGIWFGDSSRNFIRQIFREFLKKFHWWISSGTLSENSFKSSIRELVWKLQMRISPNYHSRNSNWGLL